MTGGIGFSRQGSQSFEENRKLGKIRPGITAAQNATKNTHPDPKSLAAIRDFHDKHQNKLQSQKIITWLGIGLVLILGVLFFYWVLS
ncbi:MAG: hypothetical protein LPK25_14720 [Cyclobacteriaceae bacterium]|mgnify:CR=1 FL=1|nr:hypothetical protein [Cyclobacteriaceae bacterium]